MPVQQPTADGLARQVFALQRALRHLTQHSADLGGPGVALQGVMRMIGEDGELRATELAAKLGIGPAGLSRHIADLQELGYVHRRPHPQDKRAYLIRLSELGESVLAQAMGRRAAALQQALAGWSEEQAQQAAESIGALSRTLLAEIAPNVPAITGTETAGPAPEPHLAPQEQAPK